MGVAAIGCTVEPIDGRTETIIGGVPEMGRPEVVAVARSGAMGGLCSGTVIGPYAVLTAKHCVFDELDRRVPAAELVAVVGHSVLDASGVERVIDVFEVRTTPGTDISSDVESGNDVAVLLLREDIGVDARAFAPCAAER